MGRIFVCLVAIALMPGFVPRGYSQGVTPVRPATGLKCMLLDPKSLAETRQQDLPPVLAAPDANAQQIGYPGGIVFVKVPIQEQNGYIAMLRLNGQPGWIEAAHLQPWHPANGGNARCFPMLMSNGLLGQSVH